MERLNGSEFGKCDFATTTQTFWQTASTSFLNVNNSKPLLILINQTMRNLPAECSALSEGRDLLRRKEKAGT